MIINQLELKISHLHHNDDDYLVKSRICNLCRIKIISNIKKLTEAQNQLHQAAKSLHCEVHRLVFTTFVLLHKI